MNAEATLRALAAGKSPPQSGALLQPCRLAAFGAETYGEEAIIESFRRAPLDEREPQSRSITADHAALVWDDKALIADLADGYVARLWRLGPGTPLARECAVSVPFDPVLAQSRDLTGFRASDHPGLDPKHHDRVEQAARDMARSWLVADGGPPLRASPFVIRAFSCRDQAVALVAVHLLCQRRPPLAGFVHGLIIAEAGSARCVRDQAGEAALQAAHWLPRTVTLPVLDDVS